MKHQSTQKQSISRRQLLPLLGSIFLFPFLGFGNAKNESLPLHTNNDEYQTLLKPNGTVVKVKISTIKKAEIINKNMSNKSFLNWLGKKL